MSGRDHNQARNGRRLLERGEASDAQRRMIRKLEQNPEWRPRKGRTKQTLRVCLRKGFVRIGPHGKITPLVRLE